jgi:hypothetical protein
VIREGLGRTAAAAGRTYLLQTLKAEDGGIEIRQLIAQLG